MTFKLKHVYIPNIEHEFECSEEDASTPTKFVETIVRSGLDLEQIITESMENGRLQILQALKKAKQEELKSVPPKAIEDIAPMPG